MDMNRLETLVYCDAGEELASKNAKWLNFIAGKCSQMKKANSKSLTNVTYHRQIGKTARETVKKERAANEKHVGNEVHPEPEPQSN